MGLSWHGFHHETSGLDLKEFRRQLAQYKASLNGLKDYPYMAFRAWFTDAVMPVGAPHGHNVERLIDIQPNGNANFCVDFPDYVFGNVRNASIESVWNSEPARRFREYRRARPLPVCHRCGAKYMSGG